MERWRVCLFTWVAEMGMCGIMGFIVSSTPLWESEFHVIISYSLSRTDMLINCFLFLLPALLLRGMPLLRRLHEGSCTQAPLHSEWMGHKPGVSAGDGKRASSQLSPFFAQTRHGAIAHRGTQLKGGYILNRKWVKMSPCISIFIPSQWRPCHLFLHLRVQRWCLWLAAPQPPAGIWKIKLSLPSFSFHRQSPGFHRQNSAEDFVGEARSRADSRVALPELEELRERDMRRNVISPPHLARVACGRAPQWATALLLGPQSPFLPETFAFPQAHMTGIRVPLSCLVLLLWFFLH